MEKISVIVPVYNVESYLERCINSLLNQTYSNLEIILIDDGSTDRSGQICDQYKNRDEFVVIHKENAGLGMARNTGLDVNVYMLIIQMFLKLNFLKKNILVKKFVQNYYQLCLEEWKACPVLKCLFGK